ncbi:MAG: hypothetical protein KTR19_09920 [Hyphomicrobiales bacterium]|nr:hypothetical protein [Hyphomicrobiales bacterium]
MEVNFDLALKHVLKFEGGYSDHPKDPGGATNFGITIGVLREFRGRSVTKQDVRSLSLSEAANIYRTRYWDASSCNELPAGIDLAVFDCAVNQGVGRARRFLQIAAGVTPDGIVGPLTLDAVKSGKPLSLLSEFMARRMRSYGMLRSLFRTFGLGWSRRLMATHAEAIALIGAGQISRSQELPSTSRYSMNYIIQRLQEPSTYAGIAAFLASIGALGFGEQEWNQIFAAVAAIAAAFAVVIKEKPAQASLPQETMPPSNWPRQ